MPPVKVRVGQTDRYTRQNRSKLPSIVKGATTRALNKGFDSVVTVAPNNGSQLKEQMFLMADLVGVPDDLMDKLEQMDETNLSKMAQVNKYAFEMFFDYGTGSFNEGGYWEFDDEKLDDVEQFITQYERLFGQLQ